MLVVKPNYTTHHPRIPPGNKYEKNHFPKKKYDDHVWISTPGDANLQVDVMVTAIIVTGTLTNIPSLKPAARSFFNGKLQEFNRHGFC